MITQRLVSEAERLGCKAIFLTVDAPQLGRREKGIFKYIYQIFNAEYIFIVIQNLHVSLFPH